MQPKEEQELGIGTGSRKASLECWHQEMGHGRALRGECSV